MSVIKNCINCTYCMKQIYLDNICTSPKVREPYIDRFGNVCGSQYPQTRIVYPDQHLECKYFKMGFWAKVAQAKSRACAWIYSKRNVQAERQL